MALALEGKLGPGFPPPRSLKVTLQPLPRQRLLVWPRGRLFGAGTAEPGTENLMESPSAEARPEPELQTTAWPNLAS